MKRYVYSLLVASLIYMLPAQNNLFAQRGSQRYSLAVLNLAAGSGNMSNSDVRRVTAELSREIANTGMFYTMDAMDVQSKLLNQGVDPDLGCADVGCAARSGRALGVQLIVFGDIRQAGTGYTLSARMMHVGSGEIVKSKVENVDGGLRNVLSAIPGFAQDFMGLGRGSTAKKTPKPSTPAPYSTQSYEKDGGGSKWLYVGLGALVAGGIGAGVLLLNGDDGGNGSNNGGTTNPPVSTGVLGGPPTFP